MTSIEDILQIAMLTPLDDPTEKDCQWGVPVLIWGDPGVGKSKRVKRLARLTKYYSAIIFPSGRAPEDFAGIPIQDGQGGAKTVTTFAQIRELIDIGEGLLYFDEINTARPSVQSALLGVILDRRTGDIILPGAIRIVAAANDPNVSTEATPLKPSLANRFMHINMPTPSGEDWGDYQMGMNQPRELLPMVEGENLIRENWNAAFSVALAQFAGFHKARAGLLHKIPEEGHPDRARAYPTGRTWEWAMRLSAAVRILVSDTTRASMIENDVMVACVGTAAVKEFISWRIKADLPTPMDVLRNGFTPSNRVDLNYTVYSSLAAYVVGLPKGDKRNEAAVRAWKIFEKGSDGFADIIFPAMRLLLDNNLGSTASKEVAAAAAPMIQRFPTKIADRLGGVARRAT